MSLYSALEKNGILELLNDRKPKEMYVHDFLYPLMATKTQSGALIYEEDAQTIYTLAELQVLGESDLKKTVVNLDNPLTFACPRYGKEHEIPHAVLHSTGKPSIGSTAGGVVRTTADLRRAFELQAKAVVDTQCVPGTPTKTTVTAAKWTAATYAAIMTDCNTAFEAFSRAAGVYPNFIWGDPSVISIIQYAFGLLENKDGNSKALLDMTVDKPAYTSLRGALMTAARTLYRTGSSAFTNIWDKRLYMSYVQGLPNAQTKVKTYGQMFSWFAEGGEYQIEESSDKLGNVSVTAATYKDMKVVDADCIWELAGPVGGAYDLV